MSYELKCNICKGEIDTTSLYYGVEMKNGLRLTSTPNQVVDVCPNCYKKICINGVKH